MMNEPLPPSAPLQPSSTVVRADGLIVTTLGDGLAMMDQARSKYYALDDIGRFLWERMAQPVTVAALCAQALAAFAVTPAQCQADVLAFLEELRALAMIRVVADGGSAP